MAIINDAAIKNCPSYAKIVYLAGQKFLYSMNMNDKRYNGGIRITI